MLETFADISLCRRRSRRLYSPIISFCAVVRPEKMPSSSVVLTLGSNLSASRVCLSGVPVTLKRDSSCSAKMLRCFLNMSGSVVA